MLKIDQKRAADLGVSTEDIGKTVTSIGLSDDHWMTGNTIRIDGGEDIFG